MRYVCVIRRPTAVDKISTVTERRADLSAIAEPLVMMNMTITRLTINDDTC